MKKTMNSGNFMKKLFGGLAVIIMSTSVYADCTNAYLIKAERRAKVNKGLLITAAVTAGTAVAATGIGAVVSLGPGLGAVGGSVMMAGLGGGVTMGFVTLIKDELEFDNNTYYKALQVIESAKLGTVPYVLHDKLDKKISFYSLSEYEQKEINKKIIDIVTNSNSSKEFCPHKNRKSSPMGFGKLTDLIIERLNN